ncbi:MAG: DUF952 domain-containing protein [Hyphomicrobiales bacterium]|nr:DUF952 domain-containing protein [Hyphomicrobiales bacterium]
MTLIFHIAQKNDWSPDSSLYRGDTLTTEGFIHCSIRSQLIAVANRFFAGRGDLIVLVIDETRVVPPVVYENLEGGDEAYPHIYGPLNVDAVVSTFSLQCGKDGSFFPPAELAKL